MKYYQQGDVLITLIEETQLGGENAKAIKPRNLADGETTGHAHRVVEGDFKMFANDWSKSLFLKAETPCKIGHEEHKPITIDAGVYKIGIVQEFDPFENAVRAVRD